MKIVPYVSINKIAGASKPVMYNVFVAIYDDNTNKELSHRYFWDVSREQYERADRLIDRLEELDE